MRILLKKGREGPPTLTCVRPDGTRTWNRVHAFFPVHDLTHYAVETTLGFSEAFYGLVASGWELGTFEDRDARLRMPLEALWAEHVVAVLDLERGMGQLLGVGEFNAILRANLAQGGVPAFRAVHQPELDAMRRLRSELTIRWGETPAGGTLELGFNPSIDRTPRP